MGLAFFALWRNFLLLFLVFLYLFCLFLYRCLLVDGIPHIIGHAFELAKGFSDRTGQFRKLRGSDYEKGHGKNKEKLGKSDIEHRS